MLDKLSKRFIDNYIDRKELPNVDYYRYYLLLKARDLIFFSYKERDVEKVTVSKASQYYKFSKKTDKELQEILNTHGLNAMFISNLLTIK